MLVVGKLEPNLGAVQYSYFLHCSSYFFGGKRNPVNKVERGYETSICVIQMAPLSARKKLQCFLIQHKVRKDSIESEPVHMQCDSHFLQQTRQTLK